MCGLYGFVSSGGAPNRELLETIAQKAQGRGPHAHGWVVWSQRHPRVDHRGAGSVDLDELGSVAKAADVVVGHARLATSGASESWRDPRQNQPLAVNGLVVAHNGNVPDWREVEARVGLLGRLTDVDSETILLLIAQRQHEDPELTLDAHVVAALDDLEAVSPMALVVSDGRSVVTVRRSAGRLPAHPLHAMARGEGVYFCSRGIRWKGASSSELDEGVTAWRR